MRKSVTKIVKAVLGFTMAIGASTGAALSASNGVTKLEAAASWVAHTGAITAGTEYLIVRVDGAYSMNPKNATASGNTTANAGTYSQTSFTPASGPDRGFIFEDAGNGKFYIKDGVCFVRANGTTNNGLASATSNATNSNYGIWTVAETGTSGQYTIINANDRQISAYENSNWRSYGTSSGSKTNVKLYTRVSTFGTLDHIKITTPATKTTFFVGDTFSCPGMILTGYDGANENTAHTQIYSEGFTTNFDSHTFVPGDIENGKTVTVTYSGKATTYSINVEAAPDFILDGNSNTPAGVTDDTSTTDVGEGQVGGSGVKYGYYALGVNDYNSERNLEFNRSISGAYIGNNESYGKYISKIRLTLKNANYFSKFTMYKGNSAIPETTEVVSSDSGLERIYNFNNDSEYFALKQTTTGTWVNIVKIEIVLGSGIPVMNGITASVKSGTYYADDRLSSSDFEVAVTWTEGKSPTSLQSGFTWTVNGVENGSLIEGENEVVVSYLTFESSMIYVTGLEVLAKEVVKNLDTQSNLTYKYTKHDNVASDTLDNSFIGVSGTSYVDWSDLQDASNAEYAGQTSGGTNENPLVQLRTKNSNSGIITTASGGTVNKITVEWNNSSSANGHTLEIYASHGAYTSPTELYNVETQGTKVGTIVCGTSAIYEFEDDYEYIGLKSSSGAIYLDSITIEWVVGAPSYSFSNVAIKFGGQISTVLWDRLASESNGILGYGVMLTEPSVLSSEGYGTIKELYDDVEDIAGSTDAAREEVGGMYYITDTTVKYFYNPVATAPRTINGNYVWDLVKSVNGTDVGLTREYVAVAFIRTVDDGLVFLKQTRKSAAKVADDLYTVELDETLDGSLGNLAGKLD